MNWLIAASAATSVKKEASVVFGVLVVIILLPVLVLGSLTNVAAIGVDVIRLYTGSGSVTNNYDFGYCTFWAAKRREDIGKPIPNTWGDAHTWDDRAFDDGYLVDHNPAVGAVMESDAGELGHVAFVEKVNPDGSWSVSEMNVKGWDVLSNRDFKAADAQYYNFIH